MCSGELTLGGRLFFVVEFSVVRGVGEDLIATGKIGDGMTASLYRGLRRGSTMFGVSMYPFDEWLHVLGGKSLFSEVEGRLVLRWSVPLRGSPTHLPTRWMVRGARLFPCIRPKSGPGVPIRELEV